MHTRALRGSKIRALRQAHEVSQADLARYAGVSQSAISRIESKPVAWTTKDVAELIAKRFGEPVEKILANGDAP